MAKIPNKVKSTIKKFVHALQMNNIQLERVVLFGSYARGNYTEWSDIDLAIVSNAFEGSIMEDRDKIRPIKLSVSSELEVLPYTPEDFTEDDPFVKEIIETGIEI